MTQPNILLIVSDEERRNDWLEGHADLPSHERLRRSGLSFERHYTHSSPCSPSRASLFTGRYLSNHGVVDNVTFPAHQPLDPSIPTLGSLLRGVGYESAYLGKWHLEATATPDLTAHGYSGWSGDDHHYMGGAGTGQMFDPIIADQAINWLDANATSLDQPWFLSVSLVNPHDIMWFPADQPDHQAAHPEDAKILRAIGDLWLGDLRPPLSDGNYAHRFDTLPPNFDDDLHTKPEIHRRWRHVRNTEHFVGSIDHSDTATWLRQLDYYAHLHERLDESLGRILDTTDRLGIFDDTLIIYTSDHGDACGSHGLRAKLPCVYEDVMGVPLIVKEPNAEGGVRTQALSTHVDLAATIAAVAGVDSSDRSGLDGTDLSGVIADPSTSARDHILLAQDSAQSPLLRSTRYAVSGFFDGTDKYARYYGIGGGIQRDGAEADSAKLVGEDAPFDDQDHEWYQLGDDPHELVNLAHDRSRRTALRELHERLRGYEADAYGSAFARS